MERRGRFLRSYLAPLVCPLAAKKESVPAGVDQRGTILVSHRSQTLDGRLRANRAALMMDRHAERELSLSLWMDYGDC